jgi:hypothetical protein
MRFALASFRNAGARERGCRLPVPPGPDDLLSLRGGPSGASLAPGSLAYVRARAGTRLP